MSEQTQLLIGGAGGEGVFQLGKMSNRHGIIAGATGTGKTVTLQILAEAYSRLGVPVFVADIKGDLSGLAASGSPHPKIQERLGKMPLDGFQHRQFPVVFWDLLGKNGHPIRATISELGPLLLSNLLDLNDTQSGVLYAAFRIADDEGMLLLDLKDLRSMLTWMADNAKELRGEYGNITGASVGAIQRRLLVLQEQGGDQFFGEPAIELRDLMQADLSGNGVVNILDATQVVSNSPKLYSMFLLWLLSELFEQLPEVGDRDKPKFIFFFDEAHLLFDTAPKVLVDKIEQVFRLIRSKGVGIYLVTQSPTDIPEDILGQLGLRIQHALRAFTPKDQKTVKTVAETFRPNPAFDARDVVTQLNIGEALVSTLDLKGAPTPVERTLIRPPESRIGPLTEAERKERIDRSPVKERYDKAIDRESAYEMLKKRAEQTRAGEEEETHKRMQKEKSQAKPKRSGRRRQSVGEAFMKSAARSIGSQIGRRIIRGVLGSFLGKGR